MLDAADRPVPGSTSPAGSNAGPLGVIGTNRTCAEETVDHLFEDFDAGVLGSGTDTGGRDRLRALLADRGLAPSTGRAGAASMRPSAIAAPATARPG